MVRVDYIQKIVDDFGDKEIFPAWGILSMKENEVNEELHIIHSWSYGQPGSILQLATRK